MSIYPVVTYHDVEAGVAFLERAFGLGPIFFDEEFLHAAVGLGEAMVLIEKERPEELHGEHAGRGWVYIAVDDPDAHHAHSKEEGVEILNEPHTTPDGQHGYSARDPEGNLWTFGTADPARGA